MRFPKVQSLKPILSKSVCNRSRLRVRLDIGIWVVELMPMRLSTGLVLLTLVLFLRVTNGQDNNERVGPTLVYDDYQ